MGIIGSVESFSNEIFQSATEFEAYSTSINTMMNGMGDTSEDMADAIGGSGSKTKSSLLEIQDEMIRYQEKIKSLNDDIAEVMKGDNIVKAKEQLTDKLASLDQSYADKVMSINKQIDQANQDLIQKQLDREKALKDRLLTMQEDHDLAMLDKKTSLEQKLQDSLAKSKEDYDNKVADKEAKLKQDLANAINGLERAQIQKKFDDEIALENEAFAREQSLKQAQMEKSNKEELAREEEKFEKKLALIKKQEERRISEQNASDLKAHDQKLANLNAELEKEKAAHDKQAAKLKEDAEKQIKELEEQNAKKLEKYKQQLVDEERAHELSILKRQEAEAKGGGGGGGGGSAKLPGFADDDDPFKKTKESMKEMLPMLMKFEEFAPFKEADILGAAKKLTMFGANAQEVIPALGNIAATARISMTDTASLMETAMMRGNRAFRTLALQLGISQDDIKSFEVAFDKSGKVLDQGSFWRAIDKIGKSKFSGGMEAQAHTFNGAVILMQNRLGAFGQAFLGLAEDGQIQKGGLFFYIKEAVLSAAEFLTTHKDQILAVLKDVAKFLIGIGTAVVNVAKWFRENQEIILAVLFGIGTTILVALVPAFSTLTLITIPAAIAAFGTVMALAAPFIAFGLIIAGVAFAIIYAINHWDEIVVKAKEVFTNVQKTVTEAVHNVLKWLGEKVSEFTTWGEKMGSAFVDGIKKGLSKIKDAITNALEAAKKLLKGESPPEEGPFREIDIWGSNVGNAWVGGFEQAIAKIRIPDMSGKQQAMGNTSNKSYNFSNQTTNAPHINQTNNFNVSGEANADNLAERLGFQIEHYGVV